MIGSRIGSKSAFLGSRVGSSADDEDGGAIVVTRDATSLIYLPANISEWGQFISANSLTGFTTANILATWNFNEASGNPQDAINAFHLTAAGATLTYQSAVAGWTKKGLNTNAGTSTLKNIDAGLPPANTADTTLVIFSTVSVPGATKGVCAVGTPTNAQFQVDVTPKVLVADGANGASGANNFSGAVRPWLISHKSTSTTEAVYCTDQEKLVPVYSSLVTGKQIQIMGTPSGINTPVQTVLYGYLFNVCLTDAQKKSLLQAHGWTIPWT